MNIRRVQHQLDDWLEGKLVVGKTRREGIAHLKRALFISAHIDELMGKRWHPDRGEMLRTSIVAFDLLREKLAGGKGPIALLKLPLKKTQFGLRRAVAMDGIASRMEEVQPQSEPPELFVYAGRERSALRKWAASCEELELADGMMDGAVLVAVPLKKSAARGRRAVSTDTLVAFEKPEVKDSRRERDKDVRKSGQIGPAARA